MYNKTGKKNDIGRKRKVKKWYEKNSSSGSRDLIMVRCSWIKVSLFLVLPAVICALLIPIKQVPSLAVSNDFFLTEETNQKWAVIYENTSGLILATATYKDNDFSLKFGYSPELYLDEINGKNVLKPGYVIHPLDNYSDKERIIDGVEAYVFDLDLGEIRESERQEAENRYYRLVYGRDHVEETHWAIGYYVNTGELTGGVGADDFILLLIKIRSAPSDLGYELLDNYQNREDIMLNPDRAKYIFDLNEWRIRETTEAERNFLEEKYRRQALEEILRTTETLPDNRIRATLQWSTYFMYVETNSSVLGVKFDSASKQLYIEISGASGTSGILDLIIPQELIPSTNDVMVYLDGSPIDFTLTQAENYYSIHVEYTHSLRTLTVNLIALPAWYTQPLNLALITLAIVAAIGAIYWFRFRR